MPLSEVHLSAQVYFLFTTFALCTEREECVALLLGTFITNRYSTIAYVKSLIFPSERREKKRDRVEISDNDMTRAITEAEKAGLQVIGWIHSHPHITVLPSHVDLRTQHAHQAIDDRWFGIIVSCFSGRPGDTESTNKIQTTAFQSFPLNTTLDRHEIPLTLTPSPAHPLDHDVLFKLVSTLPELFFNEEKTSFENSIGTRGEKMTLSYNSNLYIQMLMNLVDKLCAPLLAAIEMRHERNLREIQAIKAQLATRK